MNTGRRKSIRKIEFSQLDKPQKSYLVSGVTSVYRPLHIVVAIDKKIDYLLIITAYEPDKKNGIKILIGEYKYELHLL